MKNTIILLFLSFFTSTIFAQTVLDSVNMTPGYAEDVFYNLHTTEKTNEPNNNWTLALTVPAQSAGIFINEGAGVQLWDAGADTADFSTIDTTGQAWNNLYNDPESFEYGAFSDFSNIGEMSGSGANQTLNYGWGSYNFFTHVLSGEKTFILRTINGDYYKTMMKSRISGEWTLRLANLSNTFDTVIVINSSLYTDQNLIYIDIDGQTLTTDRDPTNTTWDFQFTRMALPFPPGQVTTTVFINQGLEVAEVNDELSANAIYEVDSLKSDNKNIIGDDWKTFDFMGVPPSFIIDDSLSWFIKDRNEHVYHLIFTEVEGSSTGKIHFTTERIEGVAINEIETIDFQGIYPNPAQDIAHLVISSQEHAANLSVRVINVIGSQVYSQAINLDNGMTQIPIDVSTFEKGIYFVVVTDGKNTNTQKLIVE